MTTSDGQGINWKWLSGLLLSILGAVLVLCGTLAWQLRTSDTTKICALESTVSKIEKDVTEIKTEIRIHMAQAGKENGR